MDGHKFKIGDTVRINGDRRIWEVSDVGYSERMEEYTYIVGCEGSKRKVLEHQLETAPVVFTIGQIDDTLKKVELYYCSEISVELAEADDQDVQIFVNLIKEIIKDIRKELMGEPTGD